MKQITNAINIKPTFNFGQRLVLFLKYSLDKTYIKIPTTKLLKRLIILSITFNKSCPSANKNVGTSIKTIIVYFIYFLKFRPST